MVRALEGIRFLESVRRIRVRPCLASLDAFQYYDLGFGFSWTVTSFFVTALMSVKIRIAHPNGVGKRPVEHSLYRFVMMC